MCAAIQALLPSATWPHPLSVRSRLLGSCRARARALAYGGDRVEAGPDDQDGGGGAVVERAGVAVVVAGGPDGARLGYVGPERSERAEPVVALLGHGGPAERVAGVVGVGAGDAGHRLVGVVVARGARAARGCRGGEEPR
jgi:hypothetical protein